MKTLNVFTVAVLLGLSSWAFAQDKPAASDPSASEQAAVPAESSTDQSDAAQAAPTPPKFDNAVSSVKAQLDAALAEQDKLNEQITKEKVPLLRKLNALDDELSALRDEYQQTSRLLDSRSLDLHNLEAQIKAHKDQSIYLTNLLNEYSRNFESRLHIAELQRYKQPLDAAHEAMETPNVPEQKLYDVQIGVINASMDRLSVELKGQNFTGSAVDPDGMVKDGKFRLLGPAAIFMSNDGQIVGTVEQHLGSLQPNIVPFEKPEDAAAAKGLLTDGQGLFPLDPSLGKAHVIASTKETLVEHVKKGGPVMIPIFALAGAALLVALYKWVAMMLVRSPSPKCVQSVLEAVKRDDQADAVSKARALPGPVGRMLQAGVEHLKQPRELVEEIMFEKVLSTRLKLNRFLPFVAITASAAPLLGLLGTVTGIMNTFKLITVFGTGDVKTLSSGISEALITTEYGLIVAIPSLLIHAFLSRKAKGMIDRMEKAAVALINQIGKTHREPEPAPEPEPQPVNSAA